MSAESKEFTIRLAMVGGKPVVAGLNEIGQAGEKTMKSVATKTAFASTALEGMKARLVALVSVTAVSGALKALIGDLAGMKDAADKVGLTTDRLQELRYAAVQFGEAGEVMDSALLSFAQNLGAAQNGTGKFLAVLKDYNIEMKDAAGRNRSVEAVLRDYADAIRGAATQQEKLFLAGKAFGDEDGKRLIEVFSKGAEGIDEIAQRAREAGVVIDEEMIEKVDEFDKAFKRVSYTAETRMKVGLLGIGEAMDELIMRLGTLLELWKQVPVVGRAFGDKDEPNYMLRYLQYKNAPHDGLTDEDPSVFQEGLIPPDKKPKFSPGHNAENDRADTYKKVAEALKFQIEQLQRTNEEQALYNQLKAAGVTLDSAQGQQIKTLVDRYNELAKAKQEDEEQTKKNKEAARELGLSFVSAFEDAVVEGKNLSDVLQGLEQDIIRIITRKMVTEPLATAAGNLFDGFDFGKIFSIFKHSGGVAGRADTGRMVPAAAFVNAPRLHGGGVAGLKSNERPAILEEGEGVFTREQMAALGGRSGSAVKLEVKLVNETGIEMKSTERKGANGMPEIVLRRVMQSAVRDVIGQGGADGVLGARFGIKPRAG